MANQARFAAPKVVEPQLDRDVLDLVGRVWEAGGFLSLKAAREWHGGDVVMRALAMGLLAYSRLDMTIRITEGGVAALQTYGAVEEGEGGERGGDDEGKERDYEGGEGGRKGEEEE